MATAKTRSLSSLARSWHKCERFEIQGMSCPLRMAGMEEDDVDTDSKEPPPTSPTPDLQPPDLPVVTHPPIARRPTKRLPPSDDHGGGKREPLPPTLDPRLFPPLPPPGQLPFPPPFPPFIPGDPPRVPYIPPPGQRPFPDPDQQPLPIPAELYLPDGTPASLNYLRDANETGEFDPDNNDEQRPLTAPERIRQWNRQYNQVFTTKPNIFFPGLPPAPTKNPNSSLSPQSITLLEQYVQAADLSESLYARRFGQVYAPSRNNDPGLVTDTPSQTSPANSSISNLAIGAGTAAAIGTGAYLIFRGSSGGFGGPRGGATNRGGGMGNFFQDIMSTTRGPIPAR